MDSFTPHVAAAAATSIARPAAPTWRSGIQLMGVAVLPPAHWFSYLSVSSPTCSTRTFFQSASSSSAMIIGSIVFTPCPISGFLAAIVTMPSGVMRMNALSSPGSADAAPNASPCIRPGTYVASRMPPPAMAETRRKSRRVTVSSGHWVASMPAA